MLFGKLNVRTRGIRNMRRIIFLPLAIAIITSVTACTAGGSIVILGSPDRTACTMDFREWSSKNKCELSLSKGDVLQIEVVREDGEIDLAVSGKNGSEPYTGNDLESCAFTVTISETDKYDVRISGRDATGNVRLKAWKAEPDR
jgi:hypothetical protein